MLQVSGTLVRYGPAGPQVALLARPPSANAQVRRAVVLVGGLTDGLLFAPYVAPLSEALTQRGWLVAHASIQSAWQGYGTGSLDRDAADLRQLACCLRATHGVAGVVLLGHSTGCQDAVRYVQRYGCEGGAAEAGGMAAEAGGGGGGAAGGGGGSAGGAEGCGAAPELLGTILQAPVSDHEWLCQYPELAPAVQAARELVAAGRGEEVVCRLELADGAPLCARRLLALHELGGDDDMFSAALPPEVVQKLLGPVGARPCLLLASGADECVPQPGAIVERAEALRAAIGARCRVRVVAGAPHNLAGCEVEAVQAVCEFLEALNEAETWARNAVVEGVSG